MLQPVHQVAVVRDAAEEDHRHVRVRVDEARQHGLPPRGERRLSAELLQQVGRLPDGDDFAAVDGHRTVIDVGSGHGQDGAVRDEDVDGFRRGEEGGAADDKNERKERTPQNQSSSENENGWGKRSESL